MHKLKRLIEKGVWIPNPGSVEIGTDVDPDRISGDGVTIHSGCRIFGADTFIAAGARLGEEAPATVENCAVGPKVALKGGYFKKTVFLENASCGLGAHVREGTIMEEQSSIAHTVGLKQTILFPFVTLGSLINFCDCLMAGGTGRKNHSEVGSSYIHFNFTPNQDKATASLIGDVPNGVMLDRHPIFLGGQGGIIGPCRLAFGTVVAAGTLVRKDELRPNRMLFGGAIRGGSVKFTAGKYTGARRILQNNLQYIANLMALEQWYTSVRGLFVGANFPAPLHQSLLENIRCAIDERVSRFEVFCRQYAESEGRFDIDAWWPELANLYRAATMPGGNRQLRETFLEQLQITASKHDRDYLRTIQSLDRSVRAGGSAWLQGIVDDTCRTSAQLVPFLAGTTNGTGR
jgi:UDP-N-acetylglucosamine/UDP-N-acetylgalactosamine diphosphorylase